MTPFQRLVAVAALAGSLAGLLATAVHHATTVPLIVRAEVLETAAPTGRADAHHDAAAWHPHDGFERVASTALTEVATGIGFALLLVALGIIVEILFGSTVPFFGGVIPNLTALLNTLGDNGLVGLIALCIVLWLFYRRRAPA